VFCFSGAGCQGRGWQGRVCGEAGGLWGLRAGPRWGRQAGTSLQAAGEEEEEEEELVLAAGSLPGQPSQRGAEQVEGRRGDGVAEPALPAAARCPGLSPAGPWHLAAGKWEPSGAARAGSVLGTGDGFDTLGSVAGANGAAVEMPLSVPL